MYLERECRSADFNAGVWRQIRVVVSEVVGTGVYSRIVMTHVGDQYCIIFSHRNAAGARYTVSPLSTLPVFHLHLQNLK